MRDRNALVLLERTSITGAWQEPTRIPIPGGYAPRWSPDGSQLAYDIRTLPTGIGVLPLGGRPRTIVQESTELTQFTWSEWSPDGSSLYFFARDASNVAGFYRVGLTGGTPQLVVRSDSPQLQLGTNGPASIGNGMIYFVVRELESDIYVMELVRK